MMHWQMPAVHLQARGIQLPSQYRQHEVQPRVHHCRSRSQTASAAVLDLSAEPCRMLSGPLALPVPLDSLSPGRTQILPLA